MLGLSHWRLLKNDVRWAVLGKIPFLIGPKEWGHSAQPIDVALPRGHQPDPSDVQRRAGDQTVDVPFRPLLPYRLFVLINNHVPFSQDCIVSKLAPSRLIK